MYFLPKNNFVFSFLINLKPIFRYLLLLLILILIWFFLFFNFYTQFEHKKITLLQEIQNLKNKENKYFTLKKEIQNLYLNIQEINQEIELLISNYYKKDVENGIDFLIRHAKNVNLTVNNCHSNGIVCKNYLDKNIIFFNCKGTFEQIIEYFKNLAESNQWLKFKIINFSNINDCINVEGTYKFYIPKKGFNWQDK